MSMMHVIKQLKKLQIAQNNGLRAVLNVDPRFSATKAHEDTGVPYLANMRKKSTCIEIYKVVPELSTPSMSRLFKVREQGRTLCSNSTVPLKGYRPRLAITESDIAIRGAHF